MMLPASLRTHHRYQIGSLAIALAGMLLLAAFLVVMPHCAPYHGLAHSAADGALQGCVDWAVQHQDVELEQLCKAGRPLSDVLDLFAARQQQGMARDAGADR